MSLPHCFECRFTCFCTCSYLRTPPWRWRK